MHAGDRHLKKLIYSILLALILFSTLVFAVFVEASEMNKTWVVSKDGTGDFTIIQSALDAAKSGDIVNVKAGIYYEHVTIAKTLQLLGENRETTVIDGGGVEPASVILVTANNVVISGFTIRNARSGGSAIWEDGFNFMIISNNIIQYNGDGIRILHSHENIIKGNIISNNPYTAVGFNWAYDNTVQGNRIENNLIGIGGGYEPCYNNIFSNNTIASNGKGIEIDFSNSKFYHNNIINNGIQVNIYTSTFSIAWDDGYPSGGNYWSDYTGVDANGDSIGDTSYVINGNNKDNYPFMNPSSIPQSPALTPLPTIPSSAPISNFENSAILWSWLILAAVAVVCVLVFLLSNRHKKKWKLSKAKLAKLVKTRGRIELADASKVTGVKMSKIKKLISEVGMDDSATQGFFVNGDKEFVLKSTTANSVLEMGKFSFADFGSKSGFSESDAKRVITELFSEKKISGTFTLNGKSFVTEGSLMDEIGKE